MAKKNVAAEQDKGKAGQVDDNVRLVVGLFIFILSLYLLVAFASYLFTWKADQSLRWQSLLDPFSLEAENVMGPIGASLASIFITRGFGLGAFCIPYLVFMGCLLVWRVRIRRVKKKVLALVLGMFLSSAILSFVFRLSYGFFVYGLGGRYGYYLVDLLSHYISYFGTGLLLLFLAVVYISWLDKRFPSRLLCAGRRMRTWGHGVWSRIQAKGGKATPARAAVVGGQDASEGASAVREEEAGKSLEKPSTPAREKKGESVSEAAPAGEGQTIAVEPAVEPKGEGLEGFQIIRPAGEEEVVLVREEGADFEVKRHEEEESNAKHISLDEPYDSTLDLSHYQMPPLELLERHDDGVVEVSEEEIVANKDRIVETLSNYGIGIVKNSATIGPTVTLYEIVPSPGVKISKIKNLEDDIALSLSALGIRIIAPIPGRGTIGIEVPNAKPSVVSMLGVLRSKKYQENGFALPIALGKTISNEAYVVDLAKMPHLLVAGATGQGKSVGLNAIIASLLYSKHPSQLKFVMVDPKKVELTLYARIEKHFLAKLPDAEEAIITDTDKVINTLNSLCIEMDSRYDLLKMAEVRNIKEYNELFINRRLNPERGHRYLPYIVLIIDEFADLIMTAGREIEMPIARLAQLARAIGIHLVIATQRPTTNIITGLIKANFPARIAFRVMSGVDSKTILDGPGANQLIGRGDMLVMDGSNSVRVQCAFLDTPEVARITEFIGNQQGYACALELPEYNPEGVDGPDASALSDLDALFKEVAVTVLEEQRCSTSTIQRRFSIGFNRAGRIVDQLEAAGIVGPQVGSKPREVLVADPGTLERIFCEVGA